MLDRLSLVLVIGWFLVGGVGHFVATDFFASIVPPYIPEHRAAVLVSGVFELLGALGLFYLPTRKAAAWSLFLLTLCVTPANVYMWQHAELFPSASRTLLGFRLLFQVVLLAAIVRCAGARWQRH